MAAGGIEAGIVPRLLRARSAAARNRGLEAGVGHPLGPPALLPPGQGQPTAPGQGHHRRTFESMTDTGGWSPLLPAEGVRGRKPQVCTESGLPGRGGPRVRFGRRGTRTNLTRGLRASLPAGFCQSLPESGWGPCGIQAKPGWARACTWGDLPMDLSVTGDMRQELYSSDSRPLCHGDLLVTLSSLTPGTGVTSETASGKGRKSGGSQAWAPPPRRPLPVTGTPL